MTEELLETEKSAAKFRVRDNFSVTSILTVTAIFSVTENSSRAKFDSGFFSFQQPLRFAALSTSRCGSVTRGSDSPPGCHSLPLARLRLRLAYPLHRGGFHTREFSVHYQLDFESIFNRRRRDLTPRSTENLYPRTLPASARYALHHTNIQNRLFRGFAKTSPPSVRFPSA